MTEEQLNAAVSEFEAFTNKYESIWKKMSEVRKPEEKASFMVSKEEFISDFSKLVNLRNDNENEQNLLLAGGLAASIIFKYSGQACLAAGTKDGLAEIGIEGDNVAELGKFYLQSEEAKK